MKFVIILMGLLGVIGTTLPKETNENYLLELGPEQALFDGSINSTISTITETIAPYDPTHVDHKEIDLLGHHAEVGSVHVEGFSNIAATHISLRGLITWTLDLVIEAPLVTATIDHWKVAGDLFFGDGHVRITLKNVKLSVVATFNPLTQDVQTLRATPSIGNAEVSITGLYNDPKLSRTISRGLNNVLMDFINNNKEFHDVISSVMLYIVQKIV